MGQFTQSEADNSGPTGCDGSLVLQVVRLIKFKFRQAVPAFDIGGKLVPLQSEVGQGTWSGAVPFRRVLRAGFMSAPQRSDNPVTINPLSDHRMLAILMSMEPREARQQCDPLAMCDQPIAQSDPFLDVLCPILCPTQGGRVECVSLQVREHVLEHAAVADQIWVGVDQPHQPAKGQVQFCGLGQFDQLLMADRCVGRIEFHRHKSYGLWCTQGP